MVTIAVNQHFIAWATNQTNLTVSYISFTSLLASQSVANYPIINTGKTANQGGFIGLGRDNNQNHLMWICGDSFCDIYQITTANFTPLN